MFEFTFLGTCAADFNTELLNTEYKDKFGKDARRASCALFGGRYMIDCGPHAIDALRIAGVALSDITDIFMTHLHSDHFNPQNVQMIANAKKEKLRLWVREDANTPTFENVEIVRMPIENTLTISDGFTVTGLEANHDRHCAPQWLLFDKEGKKFLYALDGAWFVNTTYYYLRNTKLALLVLDATCGDYEGDYRIGEHNTIPMIRVMLPSLKTWGVTDENTEIYLSHLARTLHLPHDETVERVKADGLKVAYDGLKIKI